MRPPPRGDYYPPPPPPVPPRNGSAPNPPPLPPRSTQYPNPTYATGPPVSYQTSPYGYQAPPPGPAPAPQSIPYFPPPPAGPGKPPPAPTYYSPNTPSSSSGTYSAAPVHTPQVAQSPAWYPLQPAYAPVQPATTHPQPAQQYTSYYSPPAAGQYNHGPAPINTTPATTHPQPAQQYTSYYSPPAAGQYNHGPAPINTTPAAPSYQPQYDPSSSYSPATYAPPPSSVPAATASQQQPYNFAKPQEHVAPPPSMPVSAPSQQQPYGFVNPQQHVVLPPSAPVSTPPQQQPYNFTRPQEHVAPPPSIPVSAPPQQQPYGFGNPQQQAISPTVAHVSIPPQQQPHGFVNSQHVVPPPSAHIPTPPQQPHGFVKPQDHSIPPPLPPPSTRPVDYSQASTGQQQGHAIYSSPPLPPPLPPPSTRPADSVQVGTGQQQGHSVYSPPIGPPAQVPSQTTSPGWTNVVQMPPREPTYFAASQQTPTQKQNTPGAQDTTSAPSNHSYYPPLKQLAAQVKALKDQYKHLTSSNPTAPNPAQNQTTQAPAAQTTSPNDHYYFLPPSEPIVQQQNTQGPQEFAVSSTDTYYCLPPPPLPPGPSVLSQAPQEQQPNPVAVYTESSSGLATMTTVNPLAYNPFAPDPPPQHESNPHHLGSTDPATAAVEPSQPYQVVQHDPVAILSTQMNTLNVQVDEPSQSSRVIAEEDRPRKPAPIHATGPPNDVVPYCPETRGIDYSLYWYHLADIPEYLICTRCHADHIQDTSLASHFERVKQPDDVVSTCGFWRPRVKEILWPQAVRSHDIGPLREYMKKRLDVLPCGGKVGRKADEGIKWYGMTENEINGFIACEACYEDYVVGSAFESNFTPYRQQGANETWICDLASPYISLAVVKMAKDNDWAGFVPAALQRIQCPACDGKLVAFNSRNWYLARRTIDEMHVCEACYLDKVALTRFGDELERHIPATGIDALIDNMGRSWTCDLADGNIPMAFALEAAIYRRDFTVFWNAAKVITSLVPCTPHGIIRGKWWTVMGGCDGLSVCEACYNGVLQTADTAQFFEPVERDHEATIVCSFCVASPRFKQFLSKYVEAQDRSVFSYYTDCVKKLAGIPPCPRLKPLKNGTWWGYPEILFCQDCYMSFVADTALSDLVPIKGASDDRDMVCQIWSPRMRKMWLETCSAGAPGSPESEAALDEFRAFGKRRMEVYNATVPQVEFIRQMKQMKMMSAMNQGMLSVMYSGMNSFAAVAGTTDGHLHGNSSLGWYETENGATGAQMLNNMQAGMSDANRMDEWAQMAHLIAVWSEVE